ncbi:hypothetical protein AGMMS49921_10210 [Endomicrobiia bacterium]|nr:hypothetical protein AGMMS49921_10210 [Endomicrobiia bacterium]
MLQTFRLCSPFLEPFSWKRWCDTNYEWYLPMLSLITAKDLTNATKDYFVEDNFTTFVIDIWKRQITLKAKNL